MLRGVRGFAWHVTASCRLRPDTGFGVIERRGEVPDYVSQALCCLLHRLFCGGMMFGRHRLMMPGAGSASHCNIMVFPSLV